MVEVVDSGTLEEQEIKLEMRMGFFNNKILGGKVIKSDEVLCEVRGRTSKFEITLAPQLWEGEELKGVFLLSINFQKEENKHSQSLPGAGFNSQICYDYATQANKLAIKFCQKNGYKIYHHVSSRPEFKALIVPINKKEESNDGKGELVETLEGGETVQIGVSLIGEDSKLTQDYLNLKYIIESNSIDEKNLGKLSEILGNEFVLKAIIKLKGTDVTTLPMMKRRLIDIIIDKLIKKHLGKVGNYLIFESNISGNNDELILNYKINDINEIINDLRSGTLKIEDLHPLLEIFKDRFNSIIYKELNISKEGIKGGFYNY